MIAFGTLDEQGGLANQLEILMETVDETKVFDCARASRQLGSYLEGKNKVELSYCHALRCPADTSNIAK